MAEYTREVVVRILEIVPDREMLPFCEAWSKTGENCLYRAKYLQEGHPVCGVHIAKPNTLWGNWKKGK